MSDLRELQKKVIAFRDARDWKQFHNPKDVAISLLLEASELLEHFQWKNNEEASEHVSKSREAVGDELADVLYWVLLLSHDLKIDVAKALKSKIKKNEQKYPVDKAKGRHQKYTELK